MIVLKIYVPKPGTVLSFTVREGSGIVGSPTFAERVTVDYQDVHRGNSSIKTWEDAVFHAAGRHVVHYPTVARAWVRQEDVIEVGEFRCQNDWSEKQYVITDQAALDKWKGLTATP